MKEAPMDLRDRNVTVIGMARSGLAAAALLKRLGARVTVTDAKSAEELAPAVGQLQALGVAVETGERQPSNLKKAELIVLSPGVPLEQPALVEARALAIPIISELELGYWFCQGRVAAITGTNGKTTTTHLLNAIIQEAGVPCIMAGNVGIPFTSVVESLPPQGIAVLEVSSFQLETIKEFRPTAAAILNITPDHLDRYSGMQSYIEAKARIMSKQGPNDILILNGEDKYTPLLSTQAPSRILTFSRLRPPEIEGLWVEKGRICYRLFGLGQSELMLADELLIPGPHNLENALAACALALSLGIPAKSLAKSLRQFRGVPHRLEPVDFIDGVRYVNDSKGTNVDAVMKALQSYNTPIVLILGGRDKNGDFTALRDLLKERVKAAVVMGEAADIIAHQIKGAVQVIHEKDLAGAVRSAANVAVEGDVVLLSPGCASFDQFKNFEERGEKFRMIVKQLAQEKSKARA
jgi:UDP-N-acetylmuramoylalanine--D-glutamate ligase